MVYAFPAILLVVHAGNLVAWRHGCQLVLHHYWSGEVGHRFFVLSSKFHRRQALTINNFYYQLVNK